MCKNVSVDMGNYNFKYYSEGRKGMVPAKVSSEYIPNGEFFESIKYNDKIYYIGIGEFNREYNKIEKFDDMLPLLLYSISQAKKENNINLSVLLPINLIQQKDKILEKLKGKRFDFNINNEDRSVYIHKVNILPEGMSSFYSLNKSKFSGEDKLIIDIGSRTVNITAYEATRCVLNKTYKIGVLDYYEQIRIIEEGKGNLYSIEQVEKMIKKKRIKVDAELNRDFFKKILNYIKSDINSFKDYDNVIFTGGGAIVFDNIIKKLKLNVMDEPVYSNVIGAYNIMKIYNKGVTNG